MLPNATEILKNTAKTPKTAQKQSLRELAFTDFALTQLAKIEGKKETRKQKQIRVQAHEKLCKRLIEIANELYRDEPAYYGLHD